MDHVASVPSATSGRMRPEALGLALVLHAAAALALWYLAAHAPTILPKEDPIEVTIEKPPPKPPPPPPPQAPPKAIPPPLGGVPPPADITADKRTQVRPSGEQDKDVAAIPPPALEREVPPPPAPPPAPTVTAIPTPTRPLPTAPVMPQAQAKPSPLVQHPQQRPPQVARREEPPTPPSSPFVNPADRFNRATASDNYIWSVARRLRDYRYRGPDDIRNLVVRIVVARDGRLLDVAVVRSSGLAEIDGAAVAILRQASPYAPLPAEIPGASASFTLPLTAGPMGY